LRSAATQTEHETRPEHQVVSHLGRGLASLIGDSELDGISKELGDIAAKLGISKSSLMRQALQQYLGEKASPTIRSRNGKIIVRNTTQVLFYSRVVLTAVQDALDYDPQRDNHPPPTLRIEGVDYLKELRSLVIELRRLNDNLEEAKSASPKRFSKPTKTVEKSAIDLRKHLNTFLNKYASTLGTGAGIVTVGALAALLYQLGIPETVFAQILKKIH
jgi:hypothetical protein